MIAYILKSISLYHIAKREGVSAYGLAWVPFLRGWIMGSIADRHDQYHAKPDRKFRLFCLILDILNLLLALILILMFVMLAVKLGRTAYTPSMDLSQYELSRLQLQFFALFGGMGILAFILIAAAAIMAIAGGAIEWVCRYKLLDLCRPSSVLADLVISAIFPRLGYAIILMINKNYRNDIDENAFQMRDEYNAQRY